MRSSSLRQVVATVQVSHEVATKSSFVLNIFDKFIRGVPLKTIRFVILQNPLGKTWNSKNFFTMQINAKIQHFEHGAWNLVAFGKFPLLTFFLGSVDKTSSTATVGCEFFHSQKGRVRFAMYLGVMLGSGEGAMLFGCDWYGHGAVAFWRSLS